MPKRVRALALLLLTAGLVAAGLWALRWESTTQKAYPDTYWYGRQAASFAGMHPDQADRFAARVACVRGLQPAIRGMPCSEGIRAYAAAQPPRYKRIFTTRPGYPLFAAPFVAVFGERGMTLATAALGVLAGMLMALAVRLVGGSFSQSLFATLLLFLLPTGYWLSRLLAEAGAVTAALAVLCAAALAIRKDLVLRNSLIAGGLAFGGLLIALITKSATGILLAGGLMVAAGAIVMYDRWRHGWLNKPLMVFATACAAAFIGWQLLTVVLNLPGGMDTIQDKYTKHFTQPDVPDPFSRLLEQNLNFWPSQFSTWINGGEPYAASPFLAALILGLVALFKATPKRTALLWLAAGAAGPVSLLAHPVPNEVDRLVAVVWLPVVLGFAMLLPPRGMPSSRPPGHGTAHESPGGQMQPGRSLG